MPWALSCNIPGATGRGLFIFLLNTFYVHLFKGTLSQGFLCFRVKNVLKFKLNALIFSYTLLLECQEKKIKCFSQRENKP